MQTTPSWIFRIFMFCLIAIIFNILANQNKKLNELLNNKTYTNMQTGYYNSNKLKLDIKNIINKYECRNISFIMFEYENLESINEYVNLEIGKKSLLTLLNKANYFFNDGIIYIISNNKFIVMLPKYTTEETYLLANEFIQNTKSPFYIDAIPVTIKVKSSITNCLINEINTSNIICKLEKTLEQSCIYNEDVKIFNNKKIYEKEKNYYNDLVLLYNDLQNNNLKLCYEPKIDIQNNEIIGLKAMLKWDSEDLNKKFSEIIKSADYAGFSNQITKWIIKNVSEQLRIWQNKGIYISVSVNLYSQDLQNESIINYINKYILSNEIDAKYIEFELSENTIIKNDQNTKDVLTKLKNIGIKLSLTNSKTDFNSLSYLLNFPNIFECLKINQIFSKNTLDNEKLLLIEYMIKFAHRLNLKVIADEIETKDNVNLLKKIGCDIIQGYYYSKPLLPDELEDYLFIERIS
jgi:EAL domain-containing protein (putative c-di-GMP-specific phosphodiesterase class I)/GGDEF domain-containing protein